MEQHDNKVFHLCQQLFPFKRRTRHWVRTSCLTGASVNHNVEHTYQQGADQSSHHHRLPLQLFKQITCWKGSYKAKARKTAICSPYSNRQGKSEAVLRKHAASDVCRYHNYASVYTNAGSGSKCSREIKEPF